MTTFQQTRQERIDQAAAQAMGTAGIFGGFFATIGAALRDLAELRAGATSFPHAQAAGGTTSEIFARAMSERTNSAMDWLYYAAQLHDEGERRFCIERALQVDPACPIVRAEIRRLAR